MILDDSDKKAPTENTLDVLEELLNDVNDRNPTPLKDDDGVWEWKENK